MGGSSGQIRIRYGSLPAGVCGRCIPLGSGDVITRGEMTIRPGAGPAVCGYSLARLITHETAHCLGFIGHDSGTGIMTPNANSDEITSKNAGFMRLLYSVAPGTYVPAFLKDKAHMKKPKKPTGPFRYVQY